MQVHAVSDSELQLMHIVWDLGGRARFAQVMDVLEQNDGRGRQSGRRYSAIRCPGSTTSLPGARNISAASGAKSLPSSLGQVWMGIVLRAPICAAQRPASSGPML